MTNLPFAQRLHDAIDRKRSPLAVGLDPRLDRFPAPVLDAARRLAIDGIATMASDVAVPTVAHVAAALALPGPTAETAAILCHKGRFRRFQQRHGLRQPRFLVASAFSAIRDRIDELTAPLVLKPVDVSGSRGLGMAVAATDPTIAELFERARADSRTGEVCVEELLGGTDVGGCCFLRNGSVRLGAVTRKHSRALVPTGHRIPSELPAEQERAVLAEVARTCGLAGYAAGPLDFDARVTPEGVVILEMSPRLGGNAIPLLVRRALEADVTGATIRAALDLPDALPDAPALRRPCAVLVLGSDVAGRLGHVASAEELHAAVPEVFDYTMKYEPGDRVRAFEHSGNSVGWVLFDCPGDYERLAERIRRALGLQVVPDPA